MKLPARLWACSLVLGLAGCGDDGGSGDSAVTIGSATNSTTPGTTNAMTGGDDDGGSADATEGTPTDSGNATDSADSTGGGGNAFPVCKFQCAADGDCTVNGGEDISFTCIGGTCGLACSTDDTCIATLSFWAFDPCTGNADCDTGKCIAFDGMGGCGFGPDDAACADFGLLEFQRMDVQGNMITVCGVPGGRCDTNGACFIQCDAASCGALQCGASGKCECTEDLDCVMAQAGERCTATGECAYACVSAADCPASGFDNTTALCE